MIAGHEPAGQVIATGPGCRQFKTGDRAIVYHISGCGLCYDCRRGYMISCTHPTLRRAYGWQRDGGMAGYLLAEEKDLVHLPDSLSYADGAQVACGFGTVYEGLEKIGISGNDAVLITGLGPVGLAAAALCRKLGSGMIIGVDAIPERNQFAKDLGLCDEVLVAGPDNEHDIRNLTGGHGVERAVECSANQAARGYPRPQSMQAQYGMPMQGQQPIYPSEIGMPQAAQGSQQDYMAGMVNAQQAMEGAATLTRVLSISTAHCP
jgi:threonine dehydrogenase-like Zn-dependent dehydrogenase